jgi:uncharacterized protein (TIGR00369 family)
MTTTIFDRVGVPPIALHLGWKLISWDAEARRIRVEYRPRPEFLNPAGFIQGGIIAAMLDDTMGALVVAATDGALAPSSIDMHVSFLASAKTGPLYCVGELVQLGKSIAFLAATLEDASGRPVARASTSAKLMTVAPINAESVR